MSRSGVRPPVCLSRHSTAAAACGWFAAERRAAGDIDLQRRAPYVQFSPDVLSFSMHVFYGRGSVSSGGVAIRYILPVYG